MAEAATLRAMSDMATPQPAANPDAQATVNDFLDYTEFFPSDLLRSLRLIGDLDSSYTGATQKVHELTKIYGKLPDTPAGERPDPAVLRKQIAAALEKAIYCRESTYAEASRLSEVAERHARRLTVIKQKLKALPEPPSRDPTPVPVSPQQARGLQRDYDKTPRLQLHFDPRRHAAPSTARPRDRSRKSIARAYSPAGSDSDVAMGNVDRQASRPRRPTDRRDRRDRDRDRKERKDRPRPAKQPRARPAGPAAISTSTALAMLSPPPPDVRPGSQYAPWFTLTEYEMAVLRKNMKKNSQWTPSETMIRRELERRQRGHSHYEKEKARCEETGEVFLDEEPHKPSSALIPRPASAQATMSNGAANAEAAKAPAEPQRDTLREETSTVNKGMKLNEAKEAKRVRDSKRESQREQAIRDAHELEVVTLKIKEAAENLKELDFAADSIAATPRRTSTARLNLKRKRDSSSVATVDTPTTTTREASQAPQDSGTKPPEPKRLRTNLTLIAPAPPHGLQAIAPAPPALSTPRTATPVAPSPVANTPVPLPAAAEPTTITMTTTINIPLAPEGPSSPGLSEPPTSMVSSRQVSPALPAPLEAASSPPPVDAQPTEPMDISEPVEPDEPVEPVESAEPVEKSEPIEQTESVEPIKTAGLVEPVEPIEDIEIPEPVEPVEPIEPIEDIELPEPVEPIEDIELLEPVEPTEPSEPMHDVQPTPAAQPVEPVEDPQPLEPSEDEPMEPAEDPQPVEPIGEPQPVQLSKEALPTEIVEDVSPVAPPQHTQPTVTAASSRPRRESLAPGKASSPTASILPSRKQKTPPAPEQSTKKQKTPPAPTEPTKKQKTPPAPIEPTKKQTTPPAPEQPAEKQKTPPASVQPAKKQKTPPTPVVQPAKKQKTPPAPVQPAKKQKTPTPAPVPHTRARKTATPPSEPVAEPVPETKPIISTHAMRPRSARGHVPTPKAQSEEPKLMDGSMGARGDRRHSVFSQPAIAAPTRMSTRKKPPPKGDVTSAENGQKTVTTVKRAQGSKNNKKKKKAASDTKEEDNANEVEEIDPNEPRYCICDDVSFGEMISCDNNCEKEWFHLECVGMTPADLPSRRAKWYCPDCRKSLGVDAYGNPHIPPSLPGRRGNR